VTQNQLRHEQLPLRRERPDLTRVPVISGLKPPVHTLFRAYSGTVTQNRTYCSVTTVQHHPWVRQELRMAPELAANSAARKQSIP
jgi:hypothetical protein